MTDWDSLFLQLKDHLNDTDDIPDGFDPTLVQTKDHENDTDDIPDNMDPTLIQIKENIGVRFDHENDTEDIPEALDPQDVHLRDQDGGWMSPEKIEMVQKEKAEEKAMWDKMYAKEDDDKSYELVQFNHESDDDDIPEGQDPYNVGLLQLKSKMDKQRFMGLRIGELVQVDKFEDDNFLMLSGPNDTDDIVVELN